MPIQLIPRRVFQNSQGWNPFLKMSYEYMKECFLSRTLNKTKDEFIADYSRQLSNRLMSIDEPRGLFLYYNSDRAVGLSNAFVLTNDTDTKSLYIAEFYIIPTSRAQGIGSQVIEHLIRWGKEEDAIKLVIEVGKDQEKANKFWSSFGYQLETCGSRNIYSKEIL